MRPALEPTNSAPMSLATTPTTVASSTPLPQLLGKRRISAAYEPSRPMYTTPSIVMAALGSGPLSTLPEAIPQIAVATKASTTRSGIASTPTQ